MTISADARAGIRRSTTRFLDAAGSLSEAQWLHRPDAVEWSASMITEHITIANRSVGAVIAKHLSAPITEPLGVADDEIPFLFYRGDEPPNVATPSGTWTDIGAATGALEASVAAIIEWADATDLDLRAHACRHPAFGMFDGVQWLLFVQAHTERHRAQLIGRPALAEPPQPS